MEINRNNINEIIVKCGAKPDKDYGQNFLIDPNISSRIVESLKIVEKDNVLEIGPGLGSLTHFLSLQTKEITVVDIDRRMCEFISYIYPDVNIINGDIRKVDISNYDLIVGNLPYNITTELVEFLLTNATKAKRLVLMCQLEAFDRFNDLSGASYGPLSVYLHLLGDVKKIFNVKKGCFYPVPKCNSVVFEITLKNLTKQERETYYQVYKLTKQLFLARRKTINNNLSSYLSSKEKCLIVLNKLGIDPLTRPEQIPFNKYLELYNTLKY